MSYLYSMKVTHKLNKLSTREQKKIVRLTVKWCKEFFGVNNRRKNDLAIFVGKQPARQVKVYGKFYGCYDCEKNVLNIYPEHNPTIKSLIQTVIHEYTHYTQPIRSKYYKLDEQYGYQNNPFEVVARVNEKLYKNCWKTIVEKI